MLVTERQIALPGGDLLYYDPAAFADYADDWFACLFDTLNWRQDQIRIAGRQLALPRLQAWYGDVDYCYSGIYLPAQPMPALLADIRRQLEQISGQCFNAVLANLYRNQHDSVGWHSDDEPELGPAPVIATVSLGAERCFSLRPIAVPAGQRRKSLQLPLASGSLLIMPAGMQQRWQHCVARQSSQAGARISLTFRTINPTVGDQNNNRGRP